jgi:hypothetical protein
VEDLYRVKGRGEGLNRRSIIDEKQAERKIRATGSLQAGDGR